MLFDVDLYLSIMFCVLVALIELHFFCFGCFLWSCYFVMMIVAKSWKFRGNLSDSRELMFLGVKKGCTIVVWSRTVQNFRSNFLVNFLNSCNFSCVFGFFHYLWLLASADKRLLIYYFPLMQLVRMRIYVHNWIVVMLSQLNIR